MQLISSSYQITIQNTELLWKNAHNLNFDFADALIQLDVKSSKGNMTECWEISEEVRNDTNDFC